MIISTATVSDIQALVSLMNRAYRGEDARKGWTTESDLISGESRTDIPTLTELMNQPGAVLLKHTNEKGMITGCVFLQKQKRGLYLGMLAVSPELQGAGIGKLLLDAANSQAKKMGCTSIFMTVISIRHELIAWYLRHGYQMTSERKSFPDDLRFGIPTQPLEFAILEKPI